MNLSFVLLILFITVQQLLAEQILLGNITKGSKPTQTSVVQATESDNSHALKLNVGCRIDQVKCYNSDVCISRTRVCDRIRDCIDNSDEIDCYRRSLSTTLKPRPLKCRSSYTKCYDNSQCIPLSWICDGVPDCSDKSDEIDCYRRTSTTSTSPTTTSSILNCSSGYTRCYDNVYCLPISWICNGYQECLDGSDETDCYRVPTTSTTTTRTTTSEISCGSGQMTCLDNSACISVTRICNNIQDCADNSDEIYCYCGLGQLMCLDGSRCIPVTSMCNNIQDCNDNTDEKYCPQLSSTMTRTTTSHPIACTNGFTGCYDNSKCIPIHWICDGGLPDCRDGSDEIDCYRRSTTSTSTLIGPSMTTTTILKCNTPDETSCYDNSRCIPLRWICDGDRDCIDNSDEIDCYRRPSTTLTSSTVTTPFNIPISCLPGYTKCYDNSKCVPLSWICDNFRDCGDNSDEIDCHRRINATSTSTTTTTQIQILTCSPGSTRCYDNSKCISVYWICDNDRDCNDNSDEIDCYRRPTTTTTSARTTTRQILTCNTSDEASCYDNSRCIPLRWICDGDRDCVDNSDEIDCYRRPTTTAARISTTSPQNTQIITCNPDYVSCYYVSQCVPLSWICDGYPDCSDHSDETDCYRKTSSSFSTTRITTINTGCSAGQVKCSNSTTCIFANWVCDGIRDCSDNSDETNCTTTLVNALRANDRQPVTIPMVRPNTADHLKKDKDHESTIVSDHHTSKPVRIPIAKETFFNREFIDKFTSSDKQELTTIAYQTLIRTTQEETTEGP